MKNGKGLPPGFRNCQFCGAKFWSDHPTKAFCITAHSIAYNNAARRGANQPAQDKADGVLEQKILRLEAGRDVRDRQYKAAQKEIAALQGELSTARTELSALEQPDRRPKWLVRERPDKVHRAILMAPMSDAHVGEVVRPNEIGGYNAYDMEIAEKRFRRFFQRVPLLARRFLSGVQYEGIVVPLLGDMLSGDIHVELTETNEVSVYDALIEEVNWLTAGLTIFLEEFKRVHVVSVPGNHPRNTMKPRYKKRSANNADTLLAKLVRDRLKNEKGITWEIPESMTADFQVYNVHFRAEHLDEARGGTGISAALAPLMLRVHRQRRVAMAEGRPHNILIGGHFHQMISFPSQGLIVNGAMKGYDEYARGKAFAPEPPQQGLFTITPEYGVGIQTPVFVSKRSDEGW